MSIELLQNLSLASYVLAGVFFMVSVILFFRLDILKLIGDFTGANERKAIESMRLQNENAGEKSYKSMRSSTARGRLTDKISPSGRLIHNTSEIMPSATTEKFSTLELMTSANETTVLNAEMNETTVLSSGMNETTVLSPGMSETTVLSPGMSETTVLSSGMNETTVLSQGMLRFGDTVDLLEDNPVSEPEMPVLTGIFRLDIEMSFLGSTEIVE